MRPIVLLALGAVALSTAFYLPGLAPVNFCEKAKEKASCPVSFFPFVSFRKFDPDCEHLTL